MSTEDTVEPGHISGAQEDHRCIQSQAHAQGRPRNAPNLLALAELQVLHNQ